MSNIQNPTPNYWERIGTILSPKTNGDTVQVGDGTINNPSYAFESDPNTGVWWESADKFSIITKALRQSTYDATNGVKYNPDANAAFNFNYASANDTGLLNGNAISDAMYIGLGEGPSVIAAAKLAISVQNVRETYKVLYCMKVPPTNTASILTQDEVFSFLYTQTSGVKTLSSDHFLQSISYSATGTGILTSNQAAHRINLAVNTGGSGVMSYAGFKFQLFSIDTGAGLADRWWVGKEGASRNRYRGTAVVALGAFPATDSFVVAFPENLLNTNYEARSVGARGSLTIVKGPSTYTVEIRVKAVCDPSTKAVGGWTGYVEYEIFYAITAGAGVGTGYTFLGNYINWTTALAAITATIAAPGLIDADIFIVQWGADPYI